MESAKPDPKHAIPSASAPNTDPNATDVCTSASAVDPVWPPENDVDDHLYPIPLDFSQFKWNEISEAADEEPQLFQRAWPARDKEVFIPAVDLPDSPPTGRYQVPAMTVRYLVSGILYIEIDEKSSNEITGKLLQQLQTQNPDTKDLEMCKVSFHSPSGARRRRDPSIVVHITGDNTAQFMAIQTTKFILFNTALEVLDTGPSIPANLLKVVLNHIGTSYEYAACSLVALIHNSYSNFKVHDVFIPGCNYTLSNGVVIFKTYSVIWASVQIFGGPENEFPEEIIHKYMPGFIRFRGSEIQIEYVGRRRHCWRCKSRAMMPHELRDCPRGKKAREQGLCFRCEKQGHYGRNCPVNPPPYRSR